MMMVIIKMIVMMIIPGPSGPSGQYNFPQYSRRVIIYIKLYPIILMMMMMIMMMITIIIIMMIIIPMQSISFRRKSTSLSRFLSNSNRSVFDISKTNSNDNDDEDE